MRALIARFATSTFGIILIFCSVLGAFLWLITPSGSVGNVRDWVDMPTVIILLVACIPIALAGLAMARYKRKMLALLDSPEIEEAIRAAIVQAERETASNSPGQKPDATSDSN